MEQLFATATCVAASTAVVFLAPKSASRKTGGRRSRSVRGHSARWQYPGTYHRPILPELNFSQGPVTQSQTKLEHSADASAKSVTMLDGARQPDSRHPPRTIDTNRQHSNASTESQSYFDNESQPGSRRSTSNNIPKGIKPDTVNTTFNSLYEPSTPGLVNTPTAGPPPNQPELVGLAQRLAQVMQEQADAAQELKKQTSDLSKKFSQELPGSLAAASAEHQKVTAQKNAERADQDSKAAAGLSLQSVTMTKDELLTRLDREFKLKQRFQGKTRSETSYEDSLLEGANHAKGIKYKAEVIKHMIDALQSDTAPTSVPTLGNGKIAQLDPWVSNVDAMVELSKSEERETYKERRIDAEQIFDAYRKLYRQKHGQEPPNFEHEELSSKSAFKGLTPYAFGGSTRYR